jgi:hypothetical protein
MWDKCPLKNPLIEALVVKIISGNILPKASKETY